MPITITSKDFKWGERKNQASFVIQIDDTLQRDKEKRGKHGPKKGGESAVLAALTTEDHPTNDIAAKSGLHKTNANRWLRKLNEDGVVVWTQGKTKTDPDLWRLNARPHWFASRKRFTRWRREAMWEAMAMCFPISAHLPAVMRCVKRFTAVASRRYTRRYKRLVKW